MSEVEQKGGYEVYVCPGCGDELSVYDIEPFSVSDVGAPRREEGDRAGNYFCSECDLDYKPLAVVSLQSVRRLLSEIEHHEEIMPVSVLIAAGNLHPAFPESSTGAGEQE